MKFGICSACLWELTPEEAVATMGGFYRGIEWRIADLAEIDPSRPPHFVSNNRCTIAPTRGAVRQAKRLCADAGIEIIGISPYIEVGDLMAAENCIDLAQEAGTNFIRMRAASVTGEPHSSLFAKTVEFFAALVPLALQAKVRLVVEMHHGTICPSASLAHRLVSHFDPAAIGVIFDAGNLTVEGFEDYRIGFDLLGPYLAHVHLKNGAYKRPEGGGLWSRIWTPIDDGLVDIPLLFRRLTEFSYSGWISVEDFSQVRDNRAMLAYNANFLGRISE